MNEYKMEELDNKNDFDIEYNPLVPAGATIIVGNENIAVIERKSFVFTQGWDFDPNNDVYHFREVASFPFDDHNCPSHLGWNGKDRIDDL
ncbi:hypothetical protein JHK82_011990 [Glycine max]|nr:hypothetical protein JHK85_012312 [Glycine max]KAG5056988.1 hypothetical protein JHK86_011984 [Glycine max]KAG5154021.1 hypothetical protein JHK82_011990 [Glycine max]